MLGHVKRVEAGLIAVALAIAASCGGDDDSADADQPDDTDAAVDSAAPPTEAPPETTAAGATSDPPSDSTPDTTDSTTETTGGSGESDGGDLRVAMVSDGEVLLGGWYGAMEEGRLHVEEQTGLDVELIENVAVGQDAQNTIEDLASDGYDVIISIATYDAEIAAIAPEYPDTVFLQVCDATVLDNMAQYCTAVEQARYVDGVLAASLSESGQIGYVIGFEIPFVLKPLNAFVQGARSINPDATVQVVAINSWFDPTLERQAAESLVNNGVDVLTYDLSSSAVPEVASENEIPFVGYGFDDAATQAPDAWAGGSLYIWGPIWVEQINAVRDGTWETTYAYGGYESGYLGYTELSDLVPADVAALVQTKLDELADGTLDPLAGPILDNAGNVAVAEGDTADVALCCDWVADGVVGDIGG